MKLLFRLYTFGCRSALLTSVAGGMRMPFEATLVGYEPGTMGYRLWDMHTHSRSHRSSRDVTFDKSNFSSLRDVSHVLRPHLLRLLAREALVVQSPAPTAPNPAAGATYIASSTHYSLLRPNTERPGSERPSERPEISSSPLATLAPLPFTPEQLSAVLCIAPRHRSVPRTIDCVRGCGVRRRLCLGIRAVPLCPVCVV